MSAARDVPWDPRWLGQLSHDLRNQLVPLRTATDLLGRGRLDAEAQREMVSVIDRQTRRLVRMLEDLSEYGQTLSPTRPVRRDPVELALVVDVAVGQVRTALEDSRHTLELDLPRQPVEVRGDIGRLTALLRRLLDNAVRFTPAGGRIRVRVRAAPERVELCVSDSGPGIAAAQIDTVFRPPLEPRDAAGLGLSLTLARECAHLHGGELRVSRDPDLGGAALVLTLPAA